MIKRTLLTLAAAMLMTGAIAQGGASVNKIMQDDGSMKMSHSMRTYGESDMKNWGNNAMWFKDAIRDLNYRDQVVIIHALHRVPSNHEMTMRRVIQQCVASDGSSFDHGKKMSIWDTTMSGLSTYDRRTLSHTWETLAPSEKDAFTSLFSACHDRHMMWKDKAKGY